MPGLNDLFAVNQEIRELIKNVTPSSTTISPFTTTLAALVTSKFSLPSRASWALIVPSATVNFAFNSAASFASVSVTTAGLTLQGNGPLDLSNCHLHCIAASSGATVTAWVQQAAALAS